MNAKVTATACTAGSTAVDPGVDLAFCDLVCADPELLRAAFEGIIAAEWGSPQRPARPLPSTPPPRPCRPGRWAGNTNPPLPARHPGGAGRARARSPPPHPGTSGIRKDGVVAEAHRATTQRPPGDPPAHDHPRTSARNGRVPNGPDTARSSGSSRVAACIRSGPKPPTRGLGPDYVRAKSAVGMRCGTSAGDPCEDQPAGDERGLLRPARTGGTSSRRTRQIGSAAGRRGGDRGPSPLPPRLPRPS